MPVIVAGPIPDDYAGHDTPGRILDGKLWASLNGRQLGVVDDRGVRVHLASIRGWYESTGVTGSATQRAAADGGWPSPSFRAPRLLELVLRLVGASWEHVGASLREINAILPVQPATLTVTDGGETLQAMVQLVGDPLLERRGVGAQLSIALQAPDPLRYSVLERSESTGLPSTSGGMSLPLSLPLSIGATVTSGRAAVLNDGDAPTPPVHELAGPVPAGARVTLVSTGASLFVRDEVPAGRRLVLDTATQTALLDGTASRLVTGTWFDLPPGADEVAFSAPAYDPDARLTTRWRDAHQ